MSSLGHASWQNSIEERIVLTAKNRGAHSKNRQRTETDNCSNRRFAGYIQIIYIRATKSYKYGGIRRMVGHPRIIGTKMKKKTTDDDKRARRKMMKIMRSIQ